MSTEPEHGPKAGFIGHLVWLVRESIPPMNPAGRPFVAGGLLATFLIRRKSRKLGVVAGLLTAWVGWFFREPKRVAPSRPNLAIAPADGQVAMIVEAAPPAELGLGSAPLLRVSVFLSVFDVHVQRVPASGVVSAVAYKPGKFLSADLDKASDDNERNSIVLDTVDGHRLVIVQIAGLVARRILCHVKDNEKVAVGQTYGLIRFGSRVDTYLPLDSKVLVESGQRTIGGETVLAELPVLGA